MEQGVKLCTTDYDSNAEKRISDSRPPGLERIPADFSAGEGDREVFCGSKDQRFSMQESCDFLKTFADLESFTSTSASLFSSALCHP